MRDYVLAHLRDDVLLRDLNVLVVQDRSTTARLLAHLAEVDARKLYAPAGYPSMFAYCVEELRFSEESSYRRIQAARAARRFPALFAALAEGKLNLTAVCLLAPHLTPENAQELIQSASGRRKSDIEEDLVRRFPFRVPKVNEAPSIRPIGTRPEMAGMFDPQSNATDAAVSDPRDPAQPSLAKVEGHVPECPANSGPPAVTEEARFLIRFTIRGSTRDKLRHVQALLSHAVPAGDVGEVFDRALDSLIQRLEARKAGSARAKRREPSVTRRSKSTPHGSRASEEAARRVPAHVRRAVWNRDGGQCTFLGAHGRRCAERRYLELDHAEPVAKGGATSVENLRLRCRAHNQYEADRAFGEGFMSRKRDQARAAKAEARARADAAARARADAEEQARAKEQVEDLMQGLRSLGCRAHEARRAAEFAQGLQHATLEEQMRASLEFIGRRATHGQFGQGGIPGRAP